MDELQVRHCTVHESGYEAFELLFVRSVQNDRMWFNLPHQEASTSYHTRQANPRGADSRVGMVVGGGEIVGSDVCEDFASIHCTRSLPTYWKSADSSILHHLPPLALVGLLRHSDTQIRGFPRDGIAYLLPQSLWNTGEVVSHDLGLPFSLVDQPLLEWAKHWAALLAPTA